MEKWIEIAKHVASTIDREKQHVSLIVRKNQLIAVGANNWKTHPKAMEMGYMYPFLHSELDAYRKIKTPMDRLTLYNFRLVRLESLVCHVRASSACRGVLRSLIKIIYSTHEGEFNEQE